MSDRSRVRITRRQIVRAGVAAGLVGLAGCSGGTGDGDTTDAGVGTATRTDADTTATATSTATGDEDVVTVTAGPTDTPTSSGSEGGSASADTGSGESADSVGMACYTSSNDYFFRPAVIRVPVGGTVSFGVASTCRQQTLAFHPENDLPLRIPEDAESWASDVMQGSGTFEHTFERPGVYDYAGLHDTFGQVGTVVVGDPDPAGQPGLAPPQDDLPEPAREELARLNEEVRSALSD
jgi:plastocyanin